MPRSEDRFDEPDAPDVGLSDDALDHADVLEDDEEDEVAEVLPSLFDDPETVDEDEEEEEE